MNPRRRGALRPRRLLTWLTAVLMLLPLSVLSLSAPALADGSSSLSLSKNLPDGYVGAEYTGSLGVTGGTLPYTFAITSGGLPAGLGLNTTSGAVYGIPEGVGQSSFTFSVADSGNPQQVKNGSGSITVDENPSGVTVSSTPATVVAGQSTLIEGSVTGSVYGANGFTTGPVAGVKVQLQASRGGASEEDAGDVGESAVTGAGGTYQTTFDAPSHPGAITVSASVYSSVYGSVYAAAAAQTVVIVTPSGTAVEGGDTADARGGCNSAVAHYGDLSEGGCGSGVLAVVQYQGRPTQTTPLSDALTYFDAAVSAGNQFTSVTIQDCQNVSSGDTMEWWDTAAGGGSGAWETVSPAATFQTATSCLQYAATSQTSPSISQLFGTVFSVVSALPIGGQGGVSGGFPFSFGFVSRAEITALNPDTGPGVGGTLVQVSGHGFTQATAVDFGTVPASSFRVLSDTQLLAVAPAGSGDVPIRVTVNGAQSTYGPATMFAYSACAPSFSDVPPSDWAAADIAILTCNAVASGFPDGTFQPDAPVTRAQFVKMLDLALGLRASTQPTAFTDVPPGAWFAPYVSAAVQAGLVQGVTATTFAPDGTLTREQMAVLVARALDLSQAEPLTFTDTASIAPWAAVGVEEAVASGYLSGFPDGAFEPTALTTRAEAAKVLALLVENRAQ